MARLKKSEIGVHVTHAAGFGWVEISFWNINICRRQYVDISPTVKGFPDEAAARSFADSVKIVRKP